MCLDWTSLTSHWYYLAVSMADLSKIMAKHCDPSASPPRPVHVLLWHCPKGIVSECSCQGSAEREETHAEIVRETESSKRL